MSADWDPSSYARFRGLRLRPALDLLARVPDLPEGVVVDLGCGNGAVGPALRVRLPDRRLTGVDASPAMLAEAEGTGVYDALEEADAGLWAPEEPPALIFSNALLQWLPDHGTLFPRLARTLASGGTLAVQMPHQQTAPSHALLREVAADLFPDRFDFTDWADPVAGAETYHALLAPLGAVDVWETTYLQPLAPVPEGHPVRHFTASTAMRPITERLDGTGTSAFLAEYDRRLARAYPTAPNGGALFPFRRLFLTLTV